MSTNKRKDEQMKKYFYVEYYLAIKRSELFIYPTWINIKKNVCYPEQRSQTQKSNYCVIPFI